MGVLFSLFVTWMSNLFSQKQWIQFDPILDFFQIPNRFSLIQIAFKQLLVTLRIFSLSATKDSPFIHFVTHFVIYLLLLSMYVGGPIAFCYRPFCRRNMVGRQRFEADVFPSWWHERYSNPAARVLRRYGSARSREPIENLWQKSSNNYYIGWFCHLSNGSSSDTIKWRGRAQKWINQLNDVVDLSSQTRNQQLPAAIRLITSCNCCCVASCRRRLLDSRPHRIHPTRHYEGDGRQVALFIINRTFRLIASTLSTEQRVVIRIHPIALATLLLSNKLQHMLPNLNEPTILQIWEPIISSEYIPNLT